VCTVYDDLGFMVISLALVPSQSHNILSNRVFSYMSFMRQNSSSDLISGNLSCIASFPFERNLPQESVYLFSQ